MTDKHNPQVAQLFAERENAVAYGNDTRLAAVDKQLAGFGVKAAAAQERKAAAEDSAEGDAKRRTPQGRRSTGKSET